MSRFREWGDEAGGYAATGRENAEMREARDRLGRIRGKKLKVLCQSLGFRLRLWKVAADTEKAPDPVSRKMYRTPPMKPDLSMLFFFMFCAEIVFMARCSLKKFRLLNLCRPCGEHVETTITHRLRASGFHSFLILPKSRSCTLSRPRKICLRRTRGRPVSSLVGPS